MLFNSLSFLIFFAIVYLIYLIIPAKARKIFLLVASLTFYAFWNPAYLGLLVGSIAVTYLCGLLIPRLGKKALIGSLIINLGILFVFKYLDFAYDTVSKCAGMLGHTLPTFESKLLLPVGISFYIFQAVGYTVDVYRRDIEPEKNFITYALFVSFFPQLVAGPIERSKNLLGQIKNIEKINPRNFEAVQSGLLTAVFGFFLKMVIADRAAIFVDTVFSAGYSGYGGFTVITAILLFTMQIYCDFAGYTYIAIGIAKMMGFELCTNFREPYLALSLKDFWDRWHISLSTYFRDYLYFPLGGSRKGKFRKYLNIMIIFLVSGLWHGAAWHYVAWGGIHGAGRIIGELTCGTRAKIRKKLESISCCADVSEVKTDSVNPYVQKEDEQKKAGNSEWHLFREDSFSYRLWQRFFTFCFVAFAWTFFRCGSVDMALRMIKSVFTDFNPWVLTDGSLLTLGLDGKEWNILLFSLMILLLVDIFKYLGKDVKAFFAKQNPVFRILVLLVAICFIVLAGIYGPTYDATQFIYFQF